jgi:hypothetical protein
MTASRDVKKQVNHHLYGIDAQKEWYGLEGLLNEWSGS